MNKYTKKIFVFALLSISFIGSLFTSGSVFAENIQSSVYQKSIMQGLYRCYTKGAINSNAGKLSSFNKFQKLIIGGTNENYVALPTGLTGIKDNGVSCKQLFMGYSGGGGNFDGLFKMFGKSEYASNITDNNKKITLLTGMGYSQKSSSVRKTCVYYVYNNTDPYSDGKSYTNKVCLSNGTLSVEENNDLSCGDNSTICNAPVYFHTEDGKKIKIYDDDIYNFKELTYSGDWGNFKKDLNNIVSTDFYNPKSYDAFSYTFSAQESSESQDSVGDEEYKFDNAKDAAQKAVGFLYPQYKQHSDIQFTDQEKLWYYENTISNWFFKGKNLDDYYMCGISDNPSLYGNYIIININPATNAKNTAGDCGVNKDATVTDTGIHGAGERDNHHDSGYFIADGNIYVDLESVVAVINRLVNSMSDEELAEVEAESLQNGSLTGSGDPCYNAGIEGMSWVLCPVLNNTGRTVGGLEQILRDWLTIDTNKVFDQRAEVAWSVFRNIANVALIIILLIIIFSQLTGYGIDNYGIKKMLPKLIVMAVLINLSYFICQVAVDLSNILGIGLDNLFANIGEVINGGSINANVWDMVTAILGAIGYGAATIAGIALASGGGVMLVIALVFAVIIAFISIAIFFVSLAARTAIVIVFTAISPVAFALYILPNTQNLFKKWWKIFQAALVIFPICGALYGASFIIRALMVTVDPTTGKVTSTDFFDSILGIVVPFLPFIAIPTLLKGALAGLGVVGGTLAALGSGIKSTAQKGKGAIESTKGYQGLKERSQENSAERRAQRIKNRLQKAADKKGGIEKLNASQQQRLRQAQNTLNESTQRRAQNKAGVFELDEATAESRATAALENQEYKAYQDQFAGEDVDLVAESRSANDWFNKPGGTQKMRALIGAMEARGMQDDIFKMLKATPSIGNNAAVRNTLAGSSNKVLSAYGKKGNGQSFEKFMSGGGMAAYAKSKEGQDFLNGLDDKALAQINEYSKDGNQIMSADMLMTAAAHAGSEDALKEINEMLDRCTDDINFSPERLQQLKPSTVETLVKKAANSEQLTQNLINASEAISQDSRLLGSMDPISLGYINELRSSKKLNSINYASRSSTGNAQPGEVLQIDHHDSYEEDTTVYD